MKTLAAIVIFALLVAAVVIAQDPELKKSRKKRSLLALPKNSAIKVTMDLIIPVRPLSNTSTFLTFDLPFRFFLPSSSEIQSLLSTSSGKSDDFYDFRSNEERQSIFQSVKEMLGSFGFDGEACAQRAVCEVAQAPIIHHGLLGEILNFILAPPLNEDNEILAGNGTTLSYREDSHYEALRSGFAGKDCSTIFPCPLSLFHFLNVD